jgi:hypothetical protein
MSHPRDERGRFLPKDSTPFDQADFDEPDMLPRTPDGRPDVAGVLAMRQRSQTLHLLTNEVIEQGLRILSGPSTSATTWEAVALLTKAAPRYVRLGGKVPYWDRGVSKAGHITGTGH